MALRSGSSPDDHRVGLQRQLAYLFAAVGLGLCLWYGYAWWAAPARDEAYIERSAELNLALDLARLPADAQPTDVGEQQRLLARERAEVREDLNRELRQKQAGVGAGLLLLVLAAGHFWLKPPPLKRP